MAVKIRVKGKTQENPDPKPKNVKVRVRPEPAIQQVPEGTKFTLYAPTDTVKKDGKVIKVTGKNISGIGSNEELINTPINYLNSYYNSEEFKRRSGSGYKSNMSYANHGAKVYEPKTTEEDKEGSHAVPAKVLLNSRRYEEKGEPTVVYDKKQAKELGLDLYNEVAPHEYSHTTRELSPSEEQMFVNKNKSSMVRNFYKKYQSDVDAKSQKKNFSEWYGPIAEHKELPSENYSDLNSLRWNMYRQGIYDARKGPMTIEHLKKAMEDPTIKNSTLFKRVLESFKPEDIVELNNTIAMNNNNTTNTNNA